MADETFTDGEVEAFMAKLDAVDFTDKERSLLRGIAGAAIQDDVQGFDKSLTPSQSAAINSSTNLTPTERALANAIMSRQH